MPQSAQMPDGQGCPEGIVAAHRIDLARLAGERDHRQARVDVDEVPDGQLAADQYQRLTPIVEQCSYRAALVAVGGDATHHHVVAPRLGRAVDAVDEAGVELLPGVKTTPRSLLRCERNMRARGSGR